jgi:methylenetetrahydrofolate dehydrogenase (NADP+)/methenyltetrahydrofolate cyclohydrolase
MSTVSPRESDKKIIDGRQIAQVYIEELKARVQELKARSVAPTLAVLFVGENPASRTYFRVKEKLARELAIQFVAERLPEDLPEADLLSKIEALNRDPQIHGLFVEFPLPTHIRADRVRTAVAPEKDVDGITPENLGKLLIGQEGLFPSTPFGALALLKKTGVALRGRHAVMVGRSEVVGKPLALLLLREDATVTICHSRTTELARHTREAEILCVAVGRPKTITAEMVQEGAVIIDIGINATPEGIVGDVDFGPVSEKAALITPVPGGVGPMTATIVMRNTVQAASRAARNA